MRSSLASSPAAAGGSRKEWRYAFAASSFSFAALSGLTSSWSIFEAFFKASSTFGFQVMSNKAMIPDAIHAQVEELRAQIVSGAISVPSE